jgi:hypothetical protein
LPQYSAEVKNAWSYASFFNTFSRNGAEWSTEYVFMVWNLVKRKDSCAYIVVC